jgi:ribosomal protein S18 acetylase RimI-like enzyme
MWSRISHRCAPVSFAAMTIRDVTAAEHAALGDLTVRAYAQMPGHPTSEEYAATLRDVESRARHAEVLVAVADDGRLLGGVTYVADPASPYAEFSDPDEACFRMLAVDPDVQSGGVGSALVSACVERARRDGKRRISLYTAPEMTAAHRLYERFGFRRLPESDIIVEDGIELRSYVLDLEEGPLGDRH